VLLGAAAATFIAKRNGPGGLAPRAAQTP
jgi:hypothetical protein